MRKLLSLLLAAALLAMMIPAMAFAADTPSVTLGYSDWALNGVALSRSGNTLTSGTVQLTISQSGSEYVISANSNVGGTLTVPVLISGSNVYFSETTALIQGQRQFNLSVSSGSTRTCKVMSYSNPGDVIELKITYNGNVGSGVYRPAPGGINNGVTLFGESDPNTPYWAQNYNPYYPSYTPSYTPPYNPPCVPYNPPCYVPYYNYYTWYNNNYVLGDIVSVNPKPAVSTPAYLEVRSVVATGGQFGNATVSTSGYGLRVDVAAYTWADRQAVGAANGDSVRVRVRPISCYGSVFAPGTVVSAMTPTTASMLDGSSKDGAGNYVLDGDSCFYLNLTGLKAAAGYTGVGINPKLSSVCVSVGGNVIAVPVSYQTVSRSASLVSIPQSISVKPGVSATIVGTSSNGGAILPLIQWSVVSSLSDGQAVVNGYQVTGVKTGTVVLVGTAGSKSVTLTVNVVAK